MSPRPARRARGFTLLEVMIALAIVSIALVAAMRAVAVSTQHHGQLRERALALLCAQNQIAELRLRPPAAPGRARVECVQGHWRFTGEQQVQRLDDGTYAARVEVRSEDDAPPRRLAQLDARLEAPGR